jgi:TonB family protein
MKLCPTCNEEFADKFGFCPVDGTPLSSALAPSAELTSSDAEPTPALSDPPTAETEAATFYSEETIPAQGSVGAAGGGAAAAGVAALAPRGELHLTMLEDEGLTRRLMTELSRVSKESQLTWPELKRDPAAFGKRMAAGYGEVGRKFFNQPYVKPAILAPFCVMLLIAGAYGVVTLASCEFRARLGMPCKQTVAQSDEEQLELVQMLETEIPPEQEKPDDGTAGMAKGKGGGSKPKQEKPQGGGGGGRQEQVPASFGKLPPAQLAPQILPPNPHPPAITKPNLPVTPTIDADPVLFPTDNRPIPYGDPKSTSTITSSGPGTGGGIGTGQGGGVGSGQDGGVGPGRGGNTGGGDRREGGGGAGGGGGGGGEDYNRTFQPREVTRKAVITFKPEPNFTEEARKNNVTGLVKLRLVLASSGAVSNISVVKGLPDGLTEKAIAAARQIRFNPAQKDGRAVSQYITIEYNFNIY